MAKRTNQADRVKLASARPKRMKRKTPEPVPVTNYSGEWKPKALTAADIETRDKLFREEVLARIRFAPGVTALNVLAELRAFASMKADIPRIRAAVAGLIASGAVIMDTEGRYYPKPAPSSDRAPFRIGQRVRWGGALGLIRALGTCFGGDMATVAFDTGVDGQVWCKHLRRADAPCPDGCGCTKCAAEGSAIADLDKADRFDYAYIELIGYRIEAWAAPRGLSSLTLVDLVRQEFHGAMHDYHKSRTGQTCSQAIAERIYTKCEAVRVNVNAIPSGTGYSIARPAAAPPGIYHRRGNQPPVRGR